MPYKSFAAADTTYRICENNPNRTAIHLTNIDDSAVMKFSFDREGTQSGIPIYPKDTVSLYLIEGDETDLALYATSDTIVTDKLQVEEKVMTDKRKKELMLGVFSGLRVGI